MLDKCIFVEKQCHCTIVRLYAHNAIFFTQNKSFVFCKYQGVRGKIGKDSKPMKWNKKYYPQPLKGSKKYYHRLVDLKQKKHLRFGSASLAWFISIALAVATPEVLFTYWWTVVMLQWLALNTAGIISQHFVQSVDNNRVSF